MTPRESWILANLVPALAERMAARERRIMEPAQAFTLFREADPSRNGSATAWLIGAYMAGGFRVEDLAGGALSKAAGTLGAFARHRARLPPVERSLTRYAALHELDDAVLPWVRAEAEAGEAAVLASATGRERRRLERDRARRESAILVEDEECTVAVPLTLHAACWWGRGTKWCTAARDGNAFGEYLDAPLVVVTMADGERFQLYADERDLQLMDALDRPLEAVEVSGLWHVLGPLVLWAHARHGSGIHLVPETAIDDEAWLSLLDGESLEAEAWIPDRLLTERTVTRMIERERARPGGLLVLADRRPDLVADRAEEMLSACGALLGYLPGERKTPLLCGIAVGQSGHALSDVPEALKTPLLCREAVLNRGPLQHVPVAMRTAEICGIALCSPERKTALSAVPPGTVTPDMAMAVVERAPDMAEFLAPLIAEECRPALHARAVELLPDALTGVPDALRTPSMCLSAVARCGIVISTIPHERRTKALCEAAVGNLPAALAFVPEVHRTKEMYRRVARSGGPALLPLLSRRLATPAFAEELTEISPMAIGCVPQAMRTAAMCRRAVERCPAAIRYVPSDLVTEEMAVQAMTTDPAAASYVPQRFWSLLRDRVEPDPVPAWPMEELDGLRESIATGGASTAALRRRIAASRAAPTDASRDAIPEPAP